MKTATAATTAVKEVGLIGAGRMGMPMVGHLANRGFNVRVYDADPAKRAEVEKRKAAWQGDSRGLAAASEVILICVGFDRELREQLAPGGGLADVARGTIIAVLSTVDPKTVIELAAEAAKRGVHLVDSTVCRGGRAADEGTLLAFVGGEAAVVERLKPVLGAFASDIVHTGPVGTAQVAKAANNLVMWSCLIASHEALALAKRYGLDPERLREALLMSSADNYVLRTWGTNTMAWAEDDMDIVQRMAADRGIALPQAGLNRELCRLLKPKRFKLDEYGI